MNFIDNIVENTSGLQTYGEDFDKKVKMYADGIMKFCVEEGFSDSDNFAIPLKDRQYIEKAVNLVSQKLKCIHITLNPTMLRDTKIEIKELENLASKYDFIIIDWDYAITHSSELKDKMEKLYMAIYPLEIRKKLRFLLYCEDETIEMLHDRP